VHVCDSLQAEAAKRQSVFYTLEGALSLLGPADNTRAADESSVITAEERAGDNAVVFTDDLNGKLALAALLLLKRHAELGHRAHQELPERDITGRFVSLRPRDASVVNALKSRPPCRWGESIFLSECGYSA
jgi:hypothetical protein